MAVYKVVISGQLEPGHELEDVKARIARLFKLEGKTRQLDALFSNKPVTVKKGLSEKQARLYHKAIQEAGLQCQLIAEDVAAPPVSDQIDEDRPSQQQHAQAAVSTPPEEPAAEQAQIPDKQEYNPYQQPSAELATPPEDDESVLRDPLRLSFGAGWDWVTEGFAYFRMMPLKWMGVTIMFILIYVALSLIPIVNLLISLIFPALIAGLVVICHRLDQEDEFDFADMFAGFKQNFGRLVGVGAIYIVAWVAVFALSTLALGGMMGMGATMGMLQGDHEALAGFATSLGLLLWVLLMFSLSIPLMMAYWFAPALVMLHDVGVFESMKLSFIGCWRNMLPFFLYGLVVLILFLVGAIPVLLGWLIVFPIIWGSMYSAYRQIFTAELDEV